MAHNQGFLPTTVTKNCIFLEGLEDYFHLLAMKCSNILHYLPLRMLSILACCLKAKAFPFDTYNVFMMTLL